MSRYFRARIDANHGEIVSALRKVGCFVQSMAMIGCGCPDLLVGIGGKWFVIEVKDGARPPSERKLTKDETQWHAAAARHGLPVYVAESEDDALGVVGLMRVAA